MPLETYLRPEHSLSCTIHASLPSPAERQATSYRSKDAYDPIVQTKNGTMSRSNREFLKQPGRSVDHSLLRVACCCCLSVTACFSIYTIIAGITRCKKQIGRSQAIPTSLQICQHLGHEAMPFFLLYSLLLST
jgi:hypothetical protein